VILADAGVSRFSRSATIGFARVSDLSFLYSENVMFDFYEGFLGTFLSDTSTLELQQFHAPNVNLDEMDSPITDEEVWDTIRSILADRAPGLDGYTA
jgi:hypothetical protein